MKTKMYCLTLAMAVVILIGVSIGVVQAGPCELADFDSASFSDPLNIDNSYWPLEPGTTFVYEPVPNEENVVNTITVTSDTKTITVGNISIECRVVYDVEEVFVEELGEWVTTEDTYDWYAQDDAGNIWYCGEDTIEYLYNEDWGSIGESSEGSWEAGQDVAGLGVIALPGYLILADPRPGVCYQQEYYEDEAEDTAKVLRLNAKVTLENPIEDEESYEDCLVTKEWTKLDPGVVEHKHYAPGVGLVLINELKEKSVRVELVDMFYTPPVSSSAP
jgi:hypothetical protein